MWLFIFILTILIGIVWGYYFLFRNTAVGANSLYQRVSGAVIDITDALQTRMHSLTQRTFRLLAVIGLPLTEAAELEGIALNQIHQILVETLNTLHTTVRNLAITFTAWLGLLIVGTVVGMWVADWIFLGVVVLSMIVLFFITITYDPIIANIAAKYKIRRSIRPVSLVYGLSSVMVMWYFAFHGQFFYSFWIYLLSVYIIVLIALGFPSYYFMKTTNKAGIALNVTLIVLLIISIIRLSNERIYTNASLYFTNNAEKIADNIADANAEKALNIFEVTEATPVVTTIGKGGINFGSVMTDSGQIILAFQPGDEVSVISEDVTYVGNEGFVKVMTKNEYGHFVDGPAFIPARMLKKKQPAVIKNVNNSTNNTVGNKNSNIQYLDHGFGRGTKYRIHTESGQPFYLLTFSSGWQQFPSGTEFEVKSSNKEQVRPTVPGDTFLIE